MASRYGKIRTMDELDRSLVSVRKSIRNIEDSYFSTAAGIISEAGTALVLFKKFKNLFSKK